jgi:hypothetical protein
MFLESILPSMLRFASGDKLNMAFLQAQSANIAEQPLEQPSSDQSPEEQPETQTEAAAPYNPVLLIARDEIPDWKPCGNAPDSVIPPAYRRRWAQKNKKPASFYEFQPGISPTPVKITPERSKQLRDIWEFMGLLPHQIGQKVVQEQERRRLDPTYKTAGFDEAMAHLDAFIAREKALMSPNHKTDLSNDL